MLRWPFAERELRAGDLTARVLDPERDAEPLWAALAFPEVWASAPKGMPDGPADLVARLGQREDGPERITWTVSLDGVVIGTSSHFRRGECVELGATYLSPSVWGTGLHLRLVRLMIHEARANDCSGVITRADDADERANKAIQKLGFVFVHKSAEQGLRADGTRRINRVYRLDNEEVI
ncbi:GNAT family N-acetyltransferase [Propionibacterium australiense]|uniref:N-acetyltransferase n=1 Tax=Propionibacterium australiense TaxID=119981 RepID=A0A8B3FK77_9ACTN|nr:GNAT family protein [Propionibacterium australiense]RLP11145.1 N-acetyltransferase [Propionibacterium australiense]